MTAGYSDCAAQYERADRLAKTARQAGRLVRDLVSFRKCGVMIVDRSQGITQITVSHEDALWADIVRRSIQRNDEVAGKQILALHRIDRLGINEDVCERCCRIAYVRVPVE